MNDVYNCFKKNGLENISWQKLIHHYIYLQWACNNCGNFEKNADGITEKNEKKQPKVLRYSYRYKNIKEVVKPKGKFLTDWERQGHKTREQPSKIWNRVFHELFTYAMLGASLPIAVYLNKPSYFKNMGRKIINPWLQCQ